MMVELNAKIFLKKQAHLSIPTSPTCVFKSTAEKHFFQNASSCFLMRFVLKGQCQEIFRFRILTSPGPNRHVQKRFRIFLNIRKVICIFH
jgi:hypothetical protein